MAKWYRLAGSSGVLECVACSKRLQTGSPPDACPRCKQGDRPVHVCSPKQLFKPAFDNPQDWDHPSEVAKQKLFTGFGFLVRYKCPLCQHEHTRKEQ